MNCPICARPIEPNHVDFCRRCFWEVLNGKERTELHALLLRKQPRAAKVEKIARTHRARLLPRLEDRPRPQNPMKIFPAEEARPFPNEAVRNDLLIRMANAVGIVSRLERDLREVRGPVPSVHALKRSIEGINEAYRWIDDNGQLPLAKPEKP